MSEFETDVYDHAGFVKKVSQSIEGLNYILQQDPNTPMLISIAEQLEKAASMLRKVQGVRISQEIRRL